MATKLDEIKWKIYQYKSRKLLLQGIKQRRILPYDDDLIEKLRTIYYGGIPASIILLSNSMSNGYCYDRALLLAQAFLDTPDDVRLVYADVDSIRLNPLYVDDPDPHYSEHAFVERITKEGYHIIYDTSSGLIYDKDTYKKIENPKVNRINDKESIRKFIEDEKNIYKERFESDIYASLMILPMIEKTYGRPHEIYTISGLELLQREINHFKEKIKFDELIIDKIRRKK